MTDEERIALQLSRVTAPTRDDVDDSDSGLSDDGGDMSLNDSDDEVLSPEPEDNEQPFDLGHKAGVYTDDKDYGPAFWHSTDGDQNFWAHYGGLE